PESLESSIIDRLISDIEDYYPDDILRKIYGFRMENINDFLRVAIKEKVLQPDYNIQCKVTMFVNLISIIHESFTHKSCKDTQSVYDYLYDTLDLLGKLGVEEKCNFGKSYKYRHDFLIDNYTNKTSLQHFSEKELENIFDKFLKVKIGFSVFIKLITKVPMLDRNTIIWTLTHEKSFYQEYANILLSDFENPPTKDWYPDKPSAVPVSQGPAQGPPPPAQGPAQGPAQVPPPPAQVPPPPQGSAQDSASKERHQDRREKIQQYIDGLFNGVFLVSDKQMDIDVLTRAFNFNMQTIFSQLDTSMLTNSHEEEEKLLKNVKDETYKVFMDTVGNYDSNPPSWAPPQANSYASTHWGPPSSHQQGPQSSQWGPPPSQQYGQDYTSTPQQYQQQQQYYGGGGATINRANYDEYYELKDY
ncbi:MAG: hypothetical protein EB127_21695, partial [Alphaproteobacteria bacterium]|nr:hypothetical protein [Alphaproteobacteria bacterium]